ncbi:MAG: hypothetical protein KJ947_11585 [Alphaproteobacteria bacterium]|nr:hypothetical protein [Alphaproteobacteria bacterium]MBU1550198.1 hypothetical protein [Alphaproteobacteria bacterium]MBU2337881.1 hypothetical protein [Alphaproteobacteria bacterium]MBU2387861.1 hypothetical protein [Alphaproteobacteria bacterium]
MMLRNKTTGEIEHLRYGPATNAVSAGTHEFVNVDESGEVVIEKQKALPSAAKAASPARDR